MLTSWFKGRLVIQAPSYKLRWFALVILLVLLDQGSKYWASSALVYADPKAFLPYFNFTLLHNYGAAFSFLAEAGGWQRLFLAVVALVISVFLAVWILCARPEKTLEITGLSFVLGGAIGNVWDRIVLGYVVDFIDWFYVSTSSDCLPFFYPIFSTQSCHWPAFNIADAAILCGAALLIIDMLFDDKRTSD